MSDDWGLFILGMILGLTIGGFVGSFVGHHNERDIYVYLREHDPQDRCFSDNIKMDEAKACVRGAYGEAP